ncbi:hypothetical protein SNE40_007119 [Patella caerulea]|uniref:G-protein coupled receptors family 1 profile domain-containing protein n=1 Tax=Patella caerulea TaxID=87958 RepID=A0AAN8Q1W8_PATCE
MSTDNGNETSNETTNSEDYDAHQILQIISLLGIIVVGVILNCTVLLVFFGSRVVRNTRSNFCIINLVICDMIFLAIVIPMSFISVAAPRSEVAYTVTQGPLCQMTGFLSVLVCTASSLTLACIAVERYIAAVHPLHYVRMFKQRQCLAVLTICWVWAALTAIPPLLPSKPASFIYHPGTKRCSPSLKSDCWYFWYCVLMGYGIPLPIMTVCYVKITIVIRNHRRKVFGIKTRTATKTTTVLQATATLPQGRSPTDYPQVQKGSGIFHTPIMVTPTGTESHIFTNQIPTKDANRPQVQIAKRGKLVDF